MKYVQVRKGYCCIGDGPIYPCYISEEKYKHWITPYFSHAVMMDLFQYENEVNYGKCRWKQESDGAYVLYDEPGSDGDVFDVYWCVDKEGYTHTLYSVEGWTWEECTESEYNDYMEDEDMDKLTIGKEFKKFTLKEWKQFCKEGLVMPPLDDEAELQDWFDTHKIHIIANDCAIELEYDADAVNEIEFGLGEIYEAILGSGIATTGNTKGSEYPNATWKDILRFAVLDGWYEDSHSLEAEVDKCIHRFTRETFEEVMKKIDGQTSMNDELEVNFFKLDSKDLWKIFNKEERRRAFKEILCSKVEISELVDKNGRHDDKVVIIDYSIIPSGDLVGWHYGVDFDKSSEDNQDCINNYIEEMTR